MARGLCAREGRTWAVHQRIWPLGVDPKRKREQFLEAHAFIDYRASEIVRFVCRLGEWS